MTSANNDTPPENGWPSVSINLFAGYPATALNSSSWLIAGL
jgi:hypothetical protein